MELNHRKTLYESVAQSSGAYGLKIGATCGNRNRAYTLARCRSATIPTSLRKMERAAKIEFAWLVWKTSA